MTRRAARTVAFASLLAAACAEEFTPESYLDDLRVLALVAEPLEVGPGDGLAVSATAHALPDDPLAEEVWSFCPVTLGASSGFACLAPVCEIAVGAGPSASLVPSDLAAACLAALGGLPDGAALPEVVESVVRYRARSASGQEREAIQRVPLWTAGPPPDPNLPPVLLGVEIDGLPAAEGALAATVPPGGAVPVLVRVDPASVQSYVDGSGRTLSESIVVFFYATAGRFDAERATGPDALVRFEARALEPGQVEAEVWAVARDLRGGQAVAGPFRIAIGP
ncbi:MAG TPA: hypothetical protein VLS93_12065 [Anaeromyxobacteraceae bacterium]|nr:hypothetical protein [Anaeromyxobacteraceae bacterium]